MKFIICEDNVTIAHEIEHLLISMDIPPDNIEVFFSGNTLIKYIEDPNNSVQIFLLDIDLPDINGLEVAEKIRSNNLDSIIIFISSHTEYVRKAFDVLAFQFLDKPLNPEDFKTYITNAIHFLNRKQRMFHFRFNDIDHSLLQKNILYFEKEKRITHIHTNTKIYKCYMTIKELQDQLDPDIFVQINRRCIMNLSYLKKMKSTEVQLTNDKILYPSRNYKSNLKSKLFFYHHNF